MTRPASEQDTIEMARRASSEIKELRRQVDTLKQKADAYESICIILRMLPQPSQGMSEDVAWMLDNRVRELEEILEKHQTGTEAA